MKIQVARTLAFATALTASLSALALTGCDRTATSQPATQETAGQYVDDKTLAAHVKAALADNPNYKFDDVKVDASGGTVQLSGFVNTSDQKSKAVDVAKTVPGVKDVQNSISLKPAP
jgi:osmotically-inducible protein OsmY